MLAVILFLTPWRPEGSAIEHMSMSVVGLRTGPRRSNVVSRPDTGVGRSGGCERDTRQGSS
jgi:hypothetical protein